MEIKKMKNGSVKVKLKKMPDKKQLAILNTFGSFRICKKRNHERLLQSVPGKTLPLDFEIPIGQFWAV